MTATTNERRTNYLHHEPVLPRWKGALAAAAGTVKKGWLMLFDASGYLDVPATGSTKVGRVSAGFINHWATAGSADGDIPAEVEARPAPVAQSTTAGDYYADSDAPAVAYAADNDTMGALGTNRSIAGLFLGIDEVSGDAILWPGRVAHAIAVALGVAKYPGALWQKAAADATAGTATAESLIPRHPRKERVVGIEFVPAAALTANDTDYATLTVYKRAAAGGSQTALASITTKITGGSGNWTAFVAVDFGTIATPDLLVGDNLTLAITKAGSGVAVPIGFLRVKTAIG